MADPHETVTVEVQGRVLSLSRLDKVLYPETGTTKGEILHYYAMVAPAILAQLAGRPVTRRRWPDGVAASSFFEKNAPAGTPPWVRTVVLATPGSARKRETLSFPVVDDVATLTWLANSAALELHTPQWRVATAPGQDSEANPMGLPDRLVVDLDPGAPASLAQCADVAMALRDVLAGDGLAAYPVTSGSKGMQLYAAISGAQSGKVVVDYAKGLAARLPPEIRRIVVATMAKSARPGRVFLDWSQNQPAKTTITPYSLRGRPAPHAAAPRSWDELADASGLTQLSYQDVADRISEPDFQLPDPLIAGPTLPDGR